MRRLSRRLFTICSAASLLLCVAACVFWARSYSRADSANVDRIGVGACRGGFHFWVWDESSRGAGAEVPIERERYFVRSDRDIGPIEQGDLDFNSYFEWSMEVAARPFPVESLSREWQRF